MSRIVKAAFIDLFIMIIAVMPIAFSFYWAMTHFHHDTHKMDPFINSKTDMALLFGIQIYAVFLIGWIIMRDALNLSLGKRKQQIVIIDRKTKMEASRIRKVVRNLPFLFFPPIVFIMKLVDPTARFGDMLANTELKEKT